MDFTFTLPEDFLTKSPKTDLKLPEGFSEILLHSCCAPCSTAVLECLLQNNIKTTVLFYNPNIQPYDEYETRRDEWQRLCDLLNVPTIVGDYEIKEWLNCIKGFEDSPERGARCYQCFTHRLKVTAQYAKKLNINLFTTTLATSRWKNKKQVDLAGFAGEDFVPGTKYWDIDWRKGGLVTRRYAIVKEIGFYNQTYCGCAFSLKERIKQEKLKEEREKSILPSNN